uniref:H(+)-exporting diphosphatase n=1 Tax=Hirondellea gigas TaxID=1518452 RepID=A0A6A7G7M3_9CRUS
MNHHHHSVLNNRMLKNLDEVSLTVADDGYEDEPLIRRDINVLTSTQLVQQTIAEFDRFVMILGVITIVCCAMSFLSLSGTGCFVLTFVLLICLGSFYLCSWLVKWILAFPDGTPQMRHVSDAIKEGAEGFLRIQYTTITIIACVTAVAISVIYLFRDTLPDDLNHFAMASTTGCAFLLGAFCSGFSGYIGVWISVRVNVRVAAAAARNSFNDALVLSFRGGAVSAILSASMCILGISFLYLLCNIIFVNIIGVPSRRIPMLLAGYGFGASFVALFMQLGGGIFTKAADIGADMCGKIEKDIPEDDPRNPAVIADLVGDNVGDTAGSMADVFESIAAEIIGTMILGGSLAEEAQIARPELYVFFPLIIHAFDLIVSTAGILTVRSRSDSEDALWSMKRGYLVSVVLAINAFAFSTRYMLHTESHPRAWLHFFGCGLIGLATAYLLILITQYYTDYNYAPVKKIAAASSTGHGTNIIAGIAVGMESTGPPVLVISISLLSSYTLGSTSGLPASTSGLFGVAVTTMGMLCTAVYILSMNNFGPIADNAGGIIEMGHQDASVRAITDRLDAVGNVTKAATKGYAVGGSALACFVLFQAFLDEIRSFLKDNSALQTVNLMRVEVMIGGLLGIMMIFVFTGWTIDAVGQTAQQVVWEVRRQFKQKPGIFDGTERPEYGTCVEIVTKAALREMIRPATFALACPVLVGLVFRIYGRYVNSPLLGVEVLSAFVLCGTLSGLVMAIFLDNSGGAWDNAKKLLEKNGAKGTDAHFAAVTGDTVGDPFKDTAGPALHVIITTMATTVLVLGPLYINTDMLSN